MLLKLCGFQQIYLLICIYPHNSRYLTQIFYPNMYLLDCGLRVQRD